MCVCVRTLTIWILARLMNCSVLMWLLIAVVSDVSEGSVSPNRIFRPANASRSRSANADYCFVGILKDIQAMITADVSVQGCSFLIEDPPIEAIHSTEEVSDDVDMMAGTIRKFINEKVLSQCYAR